MLKFSMPMALSAACKATALTAVLVTASAASWAQAPAAAPAATAQGKKELIARVLQLQQPGIEVMAKGLAEQPALQLMQQASQALQRLPAERREAVARDIEADLRKYADEAVPIVRDRALKAAPLTIAPMLEERMNEDELRQVIAMLESPVIRKFQGMAGDMQRVLTEKVVADSKSDIEPKVRAVQQTVAKRLGIEPTPNGGASGPAAPAKK
ncbi:MAG: hypothetical protein LH480_14660 [Rubrivivax sp.]|nr:hypothetical protein [Rubrivivax sp.]